MKTATISEYDALKLELEMTKNELKTNKDMPYELYTHLTNKKEYLQQEIDKLPLLYEIWYDDYDGSMSMHNSTITLKYRYLDKNKAYEKLNELNNNCNYGKPYSLQIVQLDG